MTRRIAVLVALTIVSAVACGKKQAAPVAEIIRPVKTIVAGGAVAGALSFPARIDADEKAIMSFRVKGRLIELPIDEGQSIATGQLIGRLDPNDYQIALEEARAAYTKAEADFKRYTSLYEKEAVPLSELESKRSFRDVSKARMEQAEKNLSYTRLRAPFDGVVGRRYVENFMDVTAQQQIIDINDVRRVELRIDVSEVIVRQFEKGAKVDVSAIFENRPGERYPLELKEFASRADPATQTFEVTLVMPQPDDFTLLPGMTAEVQAILSPVAEEMLLRDEVKDLVLPAAAVIGTPDNEAYVWIVDSNMTVHKRAVRMGPIVGSADVRILSGLNGGEQVVVAGMSKLAEGMKVRLWEPTS